MSQQPTLEVESVHPLPPMILHPFTESASTVRVLESAKASLSTLKGGEGSQEEMADLDRQLLDGRYAEVRMLFYVGKDVYRWLEQCIEGCIREPDLVRANLQPQSFAHLLIKQTPVDVIEKLKSWGVIEYPRIFSRSIGIFVQFREPPAQENLQADYLRYYFRYADYAYAAWRDLTKSPILPEEKFPFILYASGEYTRMLEREWESSSSESV